MGILKPTTVSTPYSAEGTSTLTGSTSESEGSPSVQDHGDEDLDSRENERTFMDILCSRIDKIVVGRIDELLVETDSVREIEQGKGETDKDVSGIPLIAGEGVTSTPLPSTMTTVLPTFAGPLDLSVIVQPVAQGGFS